MSPISDCRVPPSRAAVIIVAERNFHGRTTLCVSLSTDAESYTHFGPLVANIIKVPFNDIAALEQALAATPNVAAFMCEPIQARGFSTFNTYLRDVNRSVSDFFLLF